jgi:hypothetical protein
MAETVGGSGSATESGDQGMVESLSKAAENAGIGKEFQDGLTAIKNDANFAIKADQLFQSLIETIKA